MFKNQTTPQSLKKEILLWLFLFAEMQHLCTVLQNIMPNLRHRGSVIAYKVNGNTGLDADSLRLCSLTLEYVHTN